MSKVRGVGGKPAERVRNVIYGSKMRIEISKTMDRTKRMRNDEELQLRAAAKRKRKQLRNAEINQNIQFRRRVV